MHLLLSVKPRWCRRILAGQKTVELRRVTPKHLEPGETIVLYESAPTSAIVGEVECHEVNDTRPRRGLSLWEDVWTTTECYNLVGLPPDEIRKYWATASSPCAIWLTGARRYKCAGMRLRNDGTVLIGTDAIKPPQSFRYLTDDQLAAIRQAAGADSPCR